MNGSGIFASDAMIRGFFGINRQIEVFFLSISFRFVVSLSDLINSKTLRFCAVKNLTKEKVLNVHEHQIKPDDITQINHFERRLINFRTFLISTYSNRLS